MTKPKPLNDGELVALIERLDRGAARTAKQFRMTAIGIPALFGLMGFAFTLRGNWDIGLAVFGFGAVLGTVLLLGVRKTSPERMRHVIAAVRDAPGDIISLRHRETSDSHRLFVHHYVDVATRTHSLTVRADDDWPEVLGMLKRRCPDIRT